jgi:transcription elongation factor Elf1
MTDKDGIMDHLEKELLEESDLIEELPFDTGDPRMVMTPEEVFERYDICPDCADTGVIGGMVDAALVQNFCHCDEGWILKALAFGTPVEIKMMLYTCPKCSSERGRGRKYDGDRHVIYCPDCKQETEREDV